MMGYHAGAKLMAALLRSERGATAIEYALVASLISVAVILGAISIGTNLENTFSNVANNLT